MSSGSTYSQSSSNFSDSMHGGVDQRTGVYTASLMIAHLKANGGAGPSLPLSLSYDPSNNINMGFGNGWGMAWPRYQQSDGTVVFAMGDKYQSRTLSGEISLADQKIVNAKASYNSAEFGGQGYQFQQRKGEIYVLDQMAQYGHWVPSRIIGAHGLGVTLAWDGTGRLLSISDEVPDETGQCPVLVSFDYNGDSGGTITLWPDTNVERKISLICRNGYLETVQVADLQWNMTYDHTIQSFGNFPLSELEFPSGSKETVFYTNDGEGHKFPSCAPQRNASVPYVARYKKQVNGIKTDRIITYKFSDENYLGFNSDMSQWESDKDNLYDVEDSYRYSSTVTRTDDDGTKVVTTNVYNKFHLLVTQTTKKNNNTSITNHTYALERGGFKAQPAHFQSPIKTESTFTDETGTQSYSTKNEYDEHANKIRTVYPDGTVEAWEYYPADGSDPDCPAAHLGVKTYLKSHTITPPSRPDAPQAPIRKTVSKYSPIYWNETQARYGIVPSRGETYSDDVLVRSSDVEYYFSPKNYFHGMVKSHVTTVYDEDQNGYPTKVSMKYAIKDGEISINTTTKSYDNLSHNTEAISCAYTGSALRRKNTLGNVETYSYDSIGRILSHTICADGQRYEHTKKFAYNLETLDDNNSYRTVTITNPQKVVSKQIMNGEGNLLSETTQVGGLEQKLLERNFDNRGRLTSVMMMDYLGPDGISLENGDITPIEQSDSVVSNLRTLSYDDWEQQDQYKLQSGAQVVQKYNPIDISTVQRIGEEGVNGTRLTSFDDAYHPRHIQMVDEQGNVKAKETVIYDGASRLSSHTNALGQTTKFVYDRFDRLTQTTYPDGMVETREYFPHRSDNQIASITVNGTIIASQTVDGFGRVLSRTVGGRNYTFAYQNDSASKPSKVTLPDGKVLTYDRIPQLGEAPRRVTASDGSYRTFAYDPLTALPTRIAQSTPNGDRDALVITLTYTPRGKVKTRTVQDRIDNTSRLFSYEYSIGGALLSYTDINGTTNITYDQFGRKASIKNARTKTTFSYGPNNMLTGWETDNDGSINSVEIAYDVFNRVVNRTIYDQQAGLELSIDIEYDDINRINKKTTTSDSIGIDLVENYTYDEGGRLSTVTYSGDGGPSNSSGTPLESIKYAYDEFGNLTKKSESPGSSVEYFYENSEDPYQLTSTSNGESLSYDRAGRLLKTSSGTYTYDTFGQIASYTTANGDFATYQYDGNGRLRSQTVNKQEKREFYYLNGKVVTEILSNGDKEVPIARTYHQQYPITQYWGSDFVTLFGCDHGGSVVTVSKGGQTTSTLYSPFGEQEQTPGEYLPGFDGEIADSLSGHYHLGQGYRTYIPSLMHFNKPDSASPFGAGGLSWYGYVNNDPINNADPTGHYSSGKAASTGAIVKAVVLGIVAVGVAAYFGLPLIADLVTAGAAASTATMAMGGLAMLSVAGAVASAGLQVASVVEAPKNPKKSAELSEWGMGLGILSAVAGFGLSKLAPKLIDGVAEAGAGAGGRGLAASDKLEEEAAKLLSGPESAQTQIVNNNFSMTKTLNQNFYYEGSSMSSTFSESDFDDAVSVRSGFSSISSRLGDATMEEASTSSVSEGSGPVTPVPPAPTPPPTPPIHTADLFSDASQSASSSVRSSTTSLASEATEGTSSSESLPSSPASEVVERPSFSDELREKVEERKTRLNLD